jgi:citrate lyase subunit beta/citryl-CoA lyase
MRAAPLRSVLYVPGDNPRALAKARELPADALILDLEDAVAPNAKPAARDSVLDALRAAPYASRTVAVRINAVASPWHESDLAAIAAAGPDAIVVPKVNSPDEVLAVERALGRARRSGDQHLGDDRDARGGAALR